MSKKKIAELIIQFGKDFFKIKPGSAGDKVADVLKGKGGKVVSKPPKGVNPTTVTPGNVASILKNSRTGAARPAPKPKPQPKPKVKKPNTNTPSKPQGTGGGNTSNAPKTNPNKSPSKAPRKPPKKLRQPQSADSGKFQKPSPSPTIKPNPKTTSPAKIKTPSTSVARPKNTPNVGGSRIVGMNPKAMRGPGLKLGTLDFESDFEVQDPPSKKYSKGPGGDQHPPATKKKEPAVKRWSRLGLQQSIKEKRPKCRSRWV